MTEIKILGTGCRKCNTLKEHVDTALKELDLEADVEKVEDINEIINFGVISTPALVVDGVVRLTGKVPSPQEVVEILKS